MTLPKVIVLAAAVVIFAIIFTVRDKIADGWDYITGKESVP